MNKKNNNQKTESLFKWLVKETQGKAGRAVNTRRVMSKFGWTKSLSVYHLRLLLHNELVKKIKSETNITKYFNLVSLEEMQSTEIIYYRVPPDGKFQKILDGFIFGGDAGRIKNNLYN